MPASEHLRPPTCRFIVSAASSRPCTFHSNTSTVMNLSRLFSPARPANTRPVTNLRPRLRDLHAFGLVSIYRRPSFFRLWEPLRGDSAHDHNY